MADFLYEIYTPVVVKGKTYIITDRRQMGAAPHMFNMYDLEAADGDDLLKLESEITYLLSLDKPTEGSFYCFNHEAVDTGTLISWCKHCNKDMPRDRDHNEYRSK